jgi:hypothetical protein
MSRFLLLAILAGQGEPTDGELIRAIIDNTEPLEAPRGERLPLYVWPAHALGTTDEDELVEILTALEARGMAAIASWKPNDAGALEDALRLARLQERLGLPISVSATSSTYGFFNGDPQTAHVDADGNPFFDESIQTERRMGCPFALDHRIPEMRERITSAVNAYAAAGVDLDFVYADWEIDGPLEWNGAWEHSKRCERCRRHVPKIEDFRSFQNAIRHKRAELQKKMLAEPVLAMFPDALVGNYGVYPHDGFRYWVDYFEELPEGPPYVVEGRAHYREWYDEFPETGFTFAMATTYPWYDTWGWYDFESADYRWFYNMLLVGTNVARSTAASTPIVTFVHWHTTEPPPEPDPSVQQLSKEKYQEFLWHLLLRGHDALFLWSPRHEALEETLLVHQVYRDSHAYRELLREGEPITFDVPSSPGPVVSALRRGSQLLVIRSDFDDTREAITLEWEDRTIEVPRRSGPQLLSLSQR